MIRKWIVLAQRIRILSVAILSAVSAAAVEVYNRCCQFDVRKDLLL